MAQQFKFTFSKIFAKQFAGFSESDQDKVLDFTEQFEKYGLQDFTQYQGKITPSWKGLDDNDPKYSYAKSNNLWHYHVGLPVYVQKHPKYKTSDWVLHFQWSYGADDIHIVDMCYHYTADGVFYLPSPDYLEKAV